MKKFTCETPSSHIRHWMRDIGFIAEEELAEASRTSPRYRSKWPALKPVQLGLARWYRLHDIKLYLDGKADQIAGESHHRIKEVVS